MVNANGTQQKFDIAVPGATMDRAFAGVMAAVGKLKTKTVTSTAPAYMVNFRTKGNLRTAGQRWSVQVIDQAGTPHIVATATPDGITGLDRADMRIARTAETFLQDAVAGALN